MDILIELNSILKSLEKEIDIAEVLDRLEIQYSNTNSRNLASAIRLAGFEVKSKSFWDKEKGKPVKKSMIQPRNL